VSSLMPSISSWVHEPKLGASSKAQHLTLLLVDLCFADPRQAHYVATIPLFSVRGMGYVVTGHAGEGADTQRTVNTSPGPHHAPIVHSLVAVRRPDSGTPCNALATASTTVDQA